MNKMNYTARQAFHTSNQVVTNFDAVFVHIAYQCMEVIKRYSEFHFNECNYKIPEYIIGYAIYDAHAIKRKLKKQLRQLEYKVFTSKDDRNTICISWQHISKTLRSDGTVKFVSTR